MNREDREILAELRQLDLDVVPLAMKIMDESVMVTGRRAVCVCWAASSDGATVVRKGPADGVVASEIVGRHSPRR